MPTPTYTPLANITLGSTTNNTTIRSIGGFYDTNFKGIDLRSSLWTSTAAVTSITLDPLVSDFAAGSRFSLYGIAG